MTKNKDIISKDDILQIEKYIYELQRYTEQVDIMKDVSMPKYDNIVREINYMSMGLSIYKKLFPKDMPVMGLCLDDIKKEDKYFSEIRNKVKKLTDKLDAQKRDRSKVKKTPNKSSKKSGSSILNVFKSYGKYDGKPIELKSGGRAEYRKGGGVCLRGMNRDAVGKNS